MMAITAAITLATSSGTAPYTTSATVTVTNGNATNANVTGLTPLLTPSGLNQQTVPGFAGSAPIGPGMNTLVTSSGGTLALTFPVQFYAPYKGSSSTEPSPADPNSQVYTVGCIVQTNATGADAFVTATTANITINAATSH